MEKDLIGGKIGSVGSYDVAFNDGKLVVTSSVADGPASASLSVSLDAGMVLDALAKAIPGTIDDAIIGVAKAALLGK